MIEILERVGTPKARESKAAESTSAVSAGELQRRARKLRYEIWSAQIQAGSEPCFATARRFVCDEIDCRWREECLRLRAEWMG